MEPKFSITKSKVECYKIRFSKGGLWADITIDSNDNTGRIQIASDYGSWQNYWGACGCPFKQFLCEIDKHYAAGKFGEGNWFDDEKTIRHFKRMIIGWLRDGDIDSERAREMWDEIIKVDESSETAFCYMIMNDCPSFISYAETPDLIRTISPQFEMFWNNIWPVFINSIKQEILENAC